ncbi:myoneurin-like [Phoenix dactylifera]|uniref:Myoneurin n=1 Tax=Phoenix dactylifera TaxID=42345 RepID=A0A8B7CBQ1_PHODC|nr:myoneurin [Phoenix dactylifera]XP_038976687.1 myoneurin-like [Phoenix dactylifera]
MGRGRGKGKKLTIVTSHEDPGSGDEEVLPAYKRRGRPQKPLKDDIDEEETEKIEEEEGDDVKPSASTKDTKGTAVENGKKRRRYSQVKENYDSVLEENSAGVRSNNEESTRPNGFRPNGSRRKSKPRRAAEAGVEFK